MQTLSAETTNEVTDIPAPGFRHVRNSLTYDDMHVIRGELADFFQLMNIPDTHIGNLLFTATEILSNLFKHPVCKADYIEIRASLSEKILAMEVLDNSTSFANFNAKCENALSRLNAGETGAECGYGLGCILKLHQSPRYIPKESSPDHLNHFQVMQNISVEHNTKNMPEQPQKKKIFLVDDDPISLQIHQRMLDGIYDVILFEKAGDALASFAEARPDLIISDLTMPDMDGIALREALAEVEGGNTTPFIFLSGHTNSENNPYISHLGVDDFLCKPVTRERLHTVLGRLLHRSQQIRTSLQGQFSHAITDLLKPALPATFGLWKFTTRHEATEAGGGDFILHHQTSANMMGILADVMGHGKQAKFFAHVYAGYLRSMFRMYAGTLDAAHFLRYLSQSIDGDPLLESIIMTCQCFQFFPEGILKVASAGHPRPIIIRQHGAELMDVMGPLPGLVGDSPYDMKSARIDHGDKVLFMTDGFMEVFDRRGQAAQLLLEHVRDAPDSSSKELADYLWEAFQQQQKKQMANRDDATIILAEYGG